MGTYAVGHKTLNEIKKMAESFVENLAKISENLGGSKEKTTEMYSIVI